VAPADFDGPTKNRHCTDLLCFLMIIASWVALTGIGVYAVQNGDIRLILNPLDYDGNICGTDFAADMTDFPMLLYINSQTGGVCVKECPNLSNATADGLTDVRTLITYSGIFQVEGAELPPDFIQVGDYSNSSDNLIGSTTADNCYPNNSTEASWDAECVARGFGFAYYAADSYEFLYRCYLTTDAEDRIAELTGSDGANTVVGADQFEDIYSFWNRLYGDLYTARKYVLGFGFGASMGVSLIYIFIMRIPFLLTTIVWTSIFISIAMFFLGGYYAWSSASDWSDEEPQTVDDKTINVTTGFSIALFVIGGILILMAVCLRSAIQDAIKCTKEAGKAVNSMILILLVPVLQSIGFLLFLVPFVYYGANLASLGEITTQDVPVGVNAEIAVRVFTFDDFTKNCGWYMLFSLFWTGNFVVALGDVSCFVLQLGLLLFCIATECLSNC